MVVLLLLVLGAPQARAASGSYVDFDRHDTYAALSAGEKDGVLVSELSGGAGELSLVSVPYSASDDSGFYNGGSYYVG